MKKVSELKRRSRSSNSNLRNSYTDNWILKSRLFVDPLLKFLFKKKLLKVDIIFQCHFGVDYYQKCKTDEIKHWFLQREVRDLISKVICKYSLLLDGVDKI